MRASRATLTSSRALRRSTAVGLSAADLARAARSNWAFFASAAVLRRSAKSAFLGLFISLLIRSREAVSGPKRRGLRSSFAQLVVRRESRRPRGRSKGPTEDNGFLQPLQPT